MSKKCQCGRPSRGSLDRLRVCYHCVAASVGWDANDGRLRRLRVSIGPNTWVPDVVVRRDRWITRAEVCGFLLLGAGILVLSLGGAYHPCATGLCRGVMPWRMTLSVFIGMLVIYALLARKTFFPFCRDLYNEVRDYVRERRQDVSRSGSADPVVLARAAFFEIQSKNIIPCLATIEDELMSLIDDRERTAASIVEDRLDPTGLVYLLVTNIAHRRLCSGQCHVYRGVLNFQGKELERAFVTASRQMVTYGVHDQEAHTIEVSKLRKELAALG
jgi:hypothetical protein